jgi:hypothetical protein
MEKEYQNHHLHFERHLSLREDELCTLTHLKEIAGRDRKKLCKIELNQISFPSNSSTLHSVFLDQQELRGELDQPG